jgi:hypothetical protein
MLPTPVFYLVAAQSVCLDSPGSGVIKMQTQILCHLVWAYCFILHLSQNDIRMKRRGICGEGTGTKEMEQNGQ